MKFKKPRLFPFSIQGKLEVFPDIIATNSFLRFRDTHIHHASIHSVPAHSRLLPGSVPSHYVVTRSPSYLAYSPVSINEYPYPSPPFISGSEYSSWTKKADEVIMAMRSAPRQTAKHSVSWVQFSDLPHFPISASLCISHGLEGSLLE